MKPTNTTPSVPADSRNSWFWLLLPGVVLLAGAAYFLVKTPNSALPSVTTTDPTTPATAPEGPAPEGMVWVPGGTFEMGDPDSPDRDAPLHKVTVSGFWMDKTEVTNGQFAAFVKATKYVTIAERATDPKDAPGVDPSKLAPFSAVFTPVAIDRPPLECNPLIWWKATPGASWRNPEGPTTHIRDKDHFPVVQIAWDDAVAYAKWAGKRLPTEAEWEFAARGGKARNSFTWGNETQGTNGKYYANTFQGRFPDQNNGADGYPGLAPVGQYPPNGFGLYDMSGNAWEWCQDWYARDYYRTSPAANPPGPDFGDPDPGSGQPQKVRRGGSFLCADEYCRRYLPGTRDKNPTDSAANHTGFRCVKDAK